MEGDVITMQEIFLFDRRGVDEEGNVVGSFRSTGIRPRFADRLKQHGIKLSSFLFGDEAGTDMSEDEVVPEARKKTEKKTLWGDRLESVG